MKRIPTGRIAFLAAVSIAFGAVAEDSGWKAVDEILGSSGKDLPGDVHRYGWPRADLHVTVGGVAVAPGLALGTWAALKMTGNGDEAMAMGDLVLLESEVEPVLGELQSGGFEILAIHNHLIGETPHVVYVHFHGRGSPVNLAKTLKAALARTGTPAPGKPASQPTAEQKKTFEELKEALGRNGTMSGPILQVGVARAGPIQEEGREIPPSMGMATALNFQAVGANVAATGDFVLVADEVNPVLRELRAHGIRVTALHSHMLRESPRLFFMHFWGVGNPKSIGEGLRAALERAK